jgi:glutamate N-acetyltransferase/amino-acid N-acetyltransferase
MMTRVVNGTVTSPTGYVAGAAAAGLKESGNLDIALLTADIDCAAAGVFTRNQVVAAPVLVSRETLAANGTRIRGVVANAGNANACTGEPGMRAARAMQRLAAGLLGCGAEQLLVLSTGVIGRQLEMDKVKAGIAAATADLTPDGGSRAARAIMTTDTVPKELAGQIELPGGVVTLGGMVKGSGMIHPDMATMLGVMTTDALVPADELQALLSMAVEQSFNCISVDGDTSTNDTVLLLANGASGVPVAGSASLGAFSDALTALCTELAQMIVRDGEGASKYVELTVTGARTAADARTVARTIATSPLVKTAFAGGDPNWGRILAAAGRAGIPFDQGNVALWISSGETDRVQLVSGGTPLGYLESDAAKVLGQGEFQVHLDLGLGSGKARVWTCDLSHKYVSINADYRT